MTKAQQKTIELIIARLEKLHGELNMIPEKQAVRAAIDALKNSTPATAGKGGEK